MNVPILSIVLVHKSFRQNLLKLKSRLPFLLRKKPFVYICRSVKLGVIAIWVAWNRDRWKGIMREVTSHTNERWIFLEYSDSNSCFEENRFGNGLVGCRVCSTCCFFKFTLFRFNRLVDIGAFRDLYIARAIQQFGVGALGHEVLEN